MPGFSLGEIIVIFVVVLIVFGPEKLPYAARFLAKAMAEIRRAMDDIRSDLSLNDLTQPQRPRNTLPPSTLTPTAPKAEQPLAEAGQEPPASKSPETAQGTPPETKDKA